MPPTSPPLPAMADVDQHEDLVAWLLSVHHEVGNHLAAVRFAAQLAHDEGGALGATAVALDRAAMQAGSLLALSRPLLLIDEPELETMRTEAFFDAVGRELMAQGQPAPRVEIDPGLPAIRVCIEALQPAITAIALRSEVEQQVSLRAVHDKGAVLLRLESRARSGTPERERTVVLRLVERLMERCEIPFAVRVGAGFSAEFWCEAAH